jgi:hypothetical protein
MSSFNNITQLNKCRTNVELEQPCHVHLCVCIGLAPIAGSLEHPLGAGIAGQGPAGQAHKFDTPVGLFVIQTLAMVVMPYRSVLVDTLTLHPRWGTCWYYEGPLGKWWMAEKGQPKPQPLLKEGED